MTTHAAQGLADACLRLTQYPPHQALEWLVDDVLADFGVKPANPPPEDMYDWLVDHAGQYARAVIASPFQDVLGQTYENIASRSRRSSLGQFFTPDSVAKLMGAILLGGDPRHAQAREDGKLWTVCEPACGSGALLLGFLENLVAAHGPAALQHWSVTGIDLDTLCARMCAAQVLANIFLHISQGPLGSQASDRSIEPAATQNRPGLGELVIYCGNSLGPSERLLVVVHAKRRGVGADLVLPAMHPARVAALRQAQRRVQVNVTDATPFDSDTTRTAPHKVAVKTTKARSRNRMSSDMPVLAPISNPDSPAEHAVSTSHTHVVHAEVNAASPPTSADQIDLFAD